MKQINKIAKELKANLAGTYNNYYHSATIYLNTEDDCLSVLTWGIGESFIEHPKHLVQLVVYNAIHGNWAEYYGTKNNWHLTRKRIAQDIKDGLYDHERFGDSYGKVVIPDWLKEEIESYLK